MPTGLCHSPYILKDCVCLTELVAQFDSRIILEKDAMNYKDMNVYFRKMNYPTLKPGPDPPISAPQVTRYKFGWYFALFNFHAFTHIQMNCLESRNRS